jgi:hypothetical protein
MRSLFIALFCGAGIARADPASDYVADKTPTTAFKYLHAVAVHPRCGNCHGRQDGQDRRIPTVGDDRHDHPMNVSMLLNDGRLGVTCLTCHQKFNVLTAGGPPGAANDLLPNFLWHMPPAHMELPPGLTPRQLCEQWLDPEKNSSELVPNRGGRDDLVTFKKEFLEGHVKIDPLVMWAWQPGPGRTPAPGSHALFIEAMEQWINAGAPCP